MPLPGAGERLEHHPPAQAGPLGQAHQQHGQDRPEPRRARQPRGSHQLAQHQGEGGDGERAGQEIPPAHHEAGKGAQGRVHEHRQASAPGQAGAQAPAKLRAETPE